MMKVPFVALALVLVAGCSGGGQTLSGPGAHTCPVDSGGIVDDPAVQPPDGATGVSPTVGSLVVPFVDGLAGQTALLRVTPPIGSSSPDAVTGPFTRTGTTLTATIPPLAANTRYFASADVLVSAGTGPLGCDVRRGYVFGSFTTQ